MIDNVTNIRCFDNKIYIKRYGEKNLVSEPYNRRFFATSGLFKPQGNLYTVAPSSRMSFFERRPVDEIIIPSSSPLNFFDSAPKKHVFHYDLYPEYQYLLYTGVRFSDQYDVCTLDIETDDSVDADNAPEPIFMVGVKHRGQYNCFDIEGCGGEKRMLESFFAWYTEEVFADIAIGWNVVGFDKKYLINRARRIGVKFDYQRFVMCECIDLWDIFEKKFGWGLMKETGGKSLNAVSKYFLKRGKMDTGGSFGKLYRRDRHKAIAYNKNDCDLTEELNEKVNCIAFLQSIQSFSGVLLRDTFWESRVIDFMILTRYNNYAFPSKDDDSPEYERYEGGYVFDPPTGIFDKVALLDFASLYPSIILSFNISPDTKCRGTGDFDIDGVSFKRDPIGIFTETLKYLYETRLDLKHKLKTIADSESLEYKNADSLQLAYKTILNSFYGVCAYKKFRLYDIDLAKSITSVGRKLLKVLKTGVEGLGLGKGLYGDTDSVFFQVTQDPEKIVNAVNNFIIPEYLCKYGLTKSYVKVEIGNFFDWIIFLGKKKKYIAKISGKTKFYIKGFLTERYDTPKHIKDDILEILHILADKGSIDVRMYLEKIKLMDLQSLVILKKLNKDPEEYATDPQHLQALNASRVLLPTIDEGIYSSNIVRMVYVRSKTLDVNVLAVDDDVQTLPEGVELDYDRYFVFYILSSMCDVYSIFGFDKIIGILEYLEPITGINEKVMAKAKDLQSEEERVVFLIKKSWTILNAKKKVKKEKGDAKT